MIKQRRRRGHYTWSPKVRRAECYWKVKWSQCQYGVGLITYAYKCPEHNPAIPFTRHFARSLKIYNMSTQHFEALNFSFSFFSFPFSFSFSFSKERTNTLLLCSFSFSPKFLRIFDIPKIFISLLLAARE